MNREEKINLLKDIDTGKRSIKSIQPITFISLKHYSDKPGDLFHEGQVMTQIEADAYIAKMQACSDICWIEILNY